MSTLRDYLRSAETFTLDGRAELIRCPTLLTEAEDDARARSARTVFGALRRPKDLIRFTSTEGAGDHCEMRNRSLLSVLGWLDATFQQRLAHV